MNVQTLEFQNTNSSLLSNNVCAESEKKAKTELIKQSKPNKITTIAEIKWQRLREENCKYKSKRKPKFSA